MIDIGKIIKRAWHILWNYRVLWIFGLLLVIAGGGAQGGGGGAGPQAQFSGDRDWSGTQSWPPLEEFNDWAQQNFAPLFNHPEQYVDTWIAIGVGLALFILIIGAAMTVLRYVSETAILRMVDEHEQTGEKVGFKQGWRMGWSRRAFRLWVIDLVVNLPVILLMLVIIAVGISIFFSMESMSEFVIVAGVIAAVGGFFLFLFIFVIGMTFLRLLRQFFARQAALEDAAIGASFRLGWQMFRQNWKSAGLTWLVMIGIGIGMGIGTFILFFLLIPVYLILLIPAVLVGALPGLLFFGIASLFTSGPLAWIIAILLALPFFFIILFAPLFLVSAWFQVYSSSVWTLAYREMKALNGGRPEPEPVLPAGDNA